MPVLLETHAKEKGTYGIVATFKDDAGNAVAPDTATWTLTDEDGTVINSREDVEISSPESSETVVLSGDDLQIQSKESGDVVRVFTIEATYTSSLGSGLPLNGSCRFVIDNLAAVS